MISLMILGNLTSSQITTRDVLQTYDVEVQDDRTEKEGDYLSAAERYDDLMNKIAFINKYNANVQEVDLDAIVTAKASMWQDISDIRQRIMTSIDLTPSEILGLESDLQLLESQYNVISEEVDYYCTLYTFDMPTDRIAEALEEVTSSYKVYEDAVFYGQLGEKEMRVPVDGEYYISSVFGTRIDPLGSGGLDFHRGVDFAANYGTPVTALFNGTVAVVAEHYGMGKYVRIDHGDGIISSYLHLSEVDVVEGQVVNQYDKIGEVGSTGVWSTGNHLHLALSVEGTYVDPLKLWDK